MIALLNDNTEAIVSHKATILNGVSQTRMRSLLNGTATKRTSTVRSPGMIEMLGM